MTDAVGYPLHRRAAADAATGAAARPPLWRSSGWQPALLLVAMIAAAAGLLLAPAGAELLRSDAELAMLLRFMAVVKAVIAIAVLGITTWRLGHPMPIWLGLLYSSGCALMMAGPGVIWHLTAVGSGAALFHGGVLLWLAALAADHDTARTLVQRVVSARRLQNNGPHAR